jgi:hypothetical protein
MEGPKIYKLKLRISREIANHKIQTQESKDESDDSDDLYNSDINENNFNIFYVNPEDARYVIHDKYPYKIRYIDEGLWVSSDKDNVLKEEESYDDLDVEYDSETKADDYLNEIPEDEILKNNDKNKNYTLNKEKMKYESKIPNKRIPKHYTITTYDKYMDNIKRDRRVLNY